MKWFDCPSALLLWNLTCFILYGFPCQAEMLVFLLRYTDVKTAFRFIWTTKPVRVKLGIDIICFDNLQKKEVNKILADIIKHMTPDRAFEDYYSQLQSVISKILAHIHDFSLLFSIVSDLFFSNFCKFSLAVDEYFSFTNFKNCFISFPKMRKFCGLL